MGHAISIIPVVWIYLWVSQYSNLVPFFVAAALLTFGGYRLVRYHRHFRVGLGVGYIQLLFWGLLLGLSHGSGLSLLPFFLTANALLLMLFHFLATSITMLLMAIVTTYFLRLIVLKRIWINFDLLWGMVLVLMGGALLVTKLLEGS
ncbi:MAG: hypothetical protein QXM16_05585 [Nitrososphaerota archaeon]